MTIEEVTKNENVDFTGIPPSYYLLGLISAFENRFQAMAEGYGRQYYEGDKLETVFCNYMYKYV